MDKVLVDTLKADLKSAKTDEETRQAMTLSMIAMIDCQFRTGQRMKLVEKLMYAICAALVAGLCGGYESVADIIKSLVFR